MLGYWDDQGFDRLIDGGDSNYPGSECTDGYWKLIWCELASEMGWTTSGTYIYMLDIGIRNTTNNLNGYSFNISDELWFSQASDDRWTFHSEVEAGYPVLYTLVPNSGFAGYHSVAGIGYYIVHDIEDDTYWRIVKDNSPVTGEYVYYDEAAVVSDTYINTVHPGGSSPAPKMAAENGKLQQSRFEMKSYPNPFNPTTTISYSLAEKSEVFLSIFNAYGQLVRRFDFGLQEARSYAIVWDGSNQQGEKASSGLYFAELRTAHQRLICRLSLLK